MSQFYHPPFPTTELPSQISRMQYWAGSKQIPNYAQIDAAHLCRCQSVICIGLPVAAIRHNTKNLRFGDLSKYYMLSPGTPAISWYDRILGVSSCMQTRGSSIFWTALRSSPTAYCLVSKRIAAVGRVNSKEPQGKKHGLIVSWNGKEFF